MNHRLLLQDLDRYRWNKPGMPRWVVLLLIYGAQASLVYRLGHWLYTSNKRRNPVWWLAVAVYYIMRWWVQATAGISISPRAEIGPGLYIGHFGNIFIGGQVRMGSNCNVSQGVTIGAFGRHLDLRSPKIGSRVYFAPGAKAFGGIEIGDDVAIGANAVVAHSIPARAVAGGIPAKVISFKGSFDLVNYADMDQDGQRQASLRLVEEGAVLSPADDSPSGCSPG